MKDIYESDLNEFLSNLLREERSIDIQNYGRIYGKEYEYINKCFLLISHKKPGWIGNNGPFIGIAPGMKPVVEDFLSQGGFIAEKESEEFEMTAKKANHELVLKQSKEIKVTRTLSIISLIIASIAIIVSIIALYK